MVLLSEKVLATGLSRFLLIKPPEEGTPVIPENKAQQDIQMDLSSQETPVSHEIGGPKPPELNKAPHREPASLKEAMDLGWTLVDLGGVRDCGYRALANAFHTQNNPQDLNQTQAQQDAAWLRTTMICHVEKHSERLQTVLVKDKNVSPEAPTPQSCIKAWVAEASKATTWIDGLALQAIAEKKGSPIVIFKRDGDTTKRFTIAPKFKHGYAMAARNSKPAGVSFASRRTLWALEATG